jgi:hypothetical protein
MRLHTIIFASLVAAAGCVGEAPDPLGGGNDNGGGGGGGGGSGDDSGGGGDPSSMTATKFLDELGKKFCDQAFSCRSSFPTDEGITFQEAFGATQQQCYADSLEWNEPQKVEQQIAAGKIKWNAADAAGCLAGITFGSCTQFWDQGPSMPASCDTALVGTVADGGACVTHLECVNALSYCDGSTRKCTPEPTGARVLDVASPLLGRAAWAKAGLQ